MEKHKSLEHSFNVHFACLYGERIALFIKNFDFWLFKNQSNKRHIHSGKYWTYNSAEAFSKIFPYLSSKQIRLVIDKMIKHQIIIKSNFNKVGYDQTSWYTFHEVFYENHKNMLQIAYDVSQERIAQKGKSSSERIDQKGNSICPNGNMHLPKWADLYHILERYNKTYEREAHSDFSTHFELYKESSNSIIPEIESELFESWIKVSTSIGFERLTKSIKSYISYLKKNTWREKASFKRFLSDVELYGNDWSNNKKSKNDSELNPEYLGFLESLKDEKF